MTAKLRARPSFINQNKKAPTAFQDNRSFEATAPPAQQRQDEKEVLTERDILVYSAASALPFNLSTSRRWPAWGPQGCSKDLMTVKRER